MKKTTSLSCFLLAAALVPCGAAWAQENLHVVKSGVNAESENAEFCLEFDKTLAPASPAHLAAALRLEADDKIIVPQNIIASKTSLCLFPLERGQRYRLNLSGLRGADDEKMAAPYSQSFTIPDRSPMLAFTASNGGVNGFGSYDSPLYLRAVNVAHAKIDVYRVTDITSMAHVWQNRAQTALAPSESVYLAHDKGQQVWEGDNIFDSAPNTTIEQQISLREKMPDLVPGLYLIVADAGSSAVAADDDAKAANKGLAPMAAAWFSRSDFSLRAIRDDNGIHVIASKPDIHLIAADKEPKQLAEAQSGANDVSLIPYPAHLDDKTSLATVIGIDQAGNVAFADVENLPALAKPPALGAIGTADLFAVPNENVAVSLSMTPLENTPPLAVPGILHLSHGDTSYADFTVPPLTQEKAALSFPAPAVQGIWNLHWQKPDGTVLADAPLRVTSNPDAPHLEVSSERDALTGEGNWPVTIKSVSSSGKPVPLTGGHASVVWQKLDPATFGWKDYSFGTPPAIAPVPAHVADFLTDLDGASQLHLTLPPRPSERGLYQAALKVTADSDAGVAAAPTLVLPLRPEATTIGIKPLAADARFAQNGIARFSLVGLSLDGKPRDVSGLSYQVYEEGRSFDWYQDEGRWKYKPEPQLRPIGGGAFSIKADGGSVLEWPVTAGNYRLEILDQAGKMLAQMPFSAGWDSTGATAAPASPLNVTLPKTLHPGVEAVAHVFLPEPAMLTAIIADTHIRKTVHELRGKGDNEITFTPAADWQSGISLTVEAASLAGLLRAGAESSLAQDATGNKASLAPTADAAIIAAGSPSAVLLRKDENATLTFGIENLNAATETYRYAFTATPGLKIENGQSGSLTLGGRQSQSLTVSLSGDQIGGKELRLDVVGEKTKGGAHVIRNWTIAVLPKTDALQSVSTVSVAPKQLLISSAPKTHDPTTPTVAFVSRRPMDGLAEILSFVFNARPFTTSELASSVDALRLWGEPLAQSGFAPDFLIAARRQEQLTRLLRHQNPDGGFAATSGSDSTMEDTASALTALGPDTSDIVKPAKNLAVAWLKQRLANTWFNDKEREPRAAAYAALAAADAIDAASLHYFSDISAPNPVPPIAEANIAAAFKHIHDPNAAAFWIKKMLDENKGVKTIPLLNALAATDALSSDDVHAAMAAMTDALRHGTKPDIKDAAELLRAIATDNADAGKARLTIGNETRNVSGVLALRLSDAGFAAARNDDSQLLSITYVSEVAAHISNSAVARHIYRMNGVELSSSEKPIRGETYVVELKGTAPDLSDNEQILLQDGGANALRPIGCPISAKMDVPSFVPWLTMSDITPTFACEFSAHAVNVIVGPTDNDKAAFSVVYFAHIDAASPADIPPPRLRVLK
ncbi:MAG: hypothetical protein WCD70_05895 [Alphaproteobacteria bacterium]